MLFKAAVAAASLFLFVEIASAQTVLSTEPPRGQLGSGEVVSVSCGPGKARKITGGSDRVGGVKTGSGSPRLRGPCVAMKN